MAWRGPSVHGPRRFISCVVQAASLALYTARRPVRRAVRSSTPRFTRPSSQRFASTRSVALAPRSVQRVGHRCPLLHFLPRPGRSARSCTRLSNRRRARIRCSSARSRSRVVPRACRACVLRASCLRVNIAFCTPGLPAAPVGAGRCPFPRLRFLAHGCRVMHPRMTRQLNNRARGDRVLRSARL